MVEVTSGRYRAREYEFIIEELFKEPRDGIDHEMWFAPEEGEVLEFRDVIHTIGD